MYKLFYNLNDRPFELKANQEYFYASHPHKQANVHIRIGLEQQEGVIVLVGEKGMGKSMLISQIVSQQDKSKNIISFIETPPMNDSEFLPAILNGLQIPYSGNKPKDLFNILYKYASQQASQEKKVLLVIDNADKLSHFCLEVIRLLATLCIAEHNLLQIVLVGTDELEVTLSSHDNQALREQISVIYTVHPLQVLETRKYIEHRLKIAGWKGDPIFDDNTFDAIYRLTGGVPFEINRYFDRLLMMGMLREVHQISAKDVASLTDSTMEKLDKFEALLREQEKLNESPEQKVKKSKTDNNSPSVKSPVQQVDQRVNNKKSFFKNTLIPMAAAFLVSAISVLAFSKMQENNFFAANDAHKGIKGHSTVLASATSMGGAPQQAKYVLDEIPARANSGENVSSNEQDSQLLNIQQLLNKSTLSISKVKQDFSNDSDPDAWGAPTVAPAMPHHNPSTHSTNELAFN